MHASLEFAFEFPKQFRDWHDTSNSVVILTVKNEEELKKQYNKFVSLGRCVSKFSEPDIGNELTSICIEPHECNKKLLSWLPLAGKVKNESRIAGENIRLKA
jgi:hypothetical protein